MSKPTCFLTHSFRDSVVPFEFSKKKRKKKRACTRERKRKEKKGKENRATIMKIEGIDWNR